LQEVENHERGNKTTINDLIEMGFA